MKDHFKKINTLIQKNTIYFILFLVFFSFPLNIILAQDVDTIDISPSIIEPTEPIEQGKSYDYSLRVTNSSNKTESFYPVIENMEGIAEGGAPIFTDMDTGHALSSWVEVKQDSVTLEPGESTSIDFTLNVPEDAGPQGYYGAFFVTREAPVLRETGAGIEVKIGTILSFRVQGDSHEEVVIREFYSEKNIYRNNETVNFTLKVDNLGNVLARPRGAASILDSSGEIIEQINVNHPRPGGVFPGDDKVFNFDWDSEGLKFGKFYAEIDLVYGENGVRSINDSISFWVIPFRLIFTVLIALLILVVTVFVFIKFYIKKKIKAATGNRKVYTSMSSQKAPISKLTVITIASLLFTALFALVVFFLFA